MPAAWDQRTDVLPLEGEVRRDGQQRGQAAEEPTSTQFVALFATSRVCTSAVGDPGMRKASTGMPEQGTQAPSPAPDLIPAGNEKQPRTYTEIGTANGGTSGAPGAGFPLLWGAAS